MMQPVERGVLELLQARWNQSTCCPSIALMGTADTSQGLR